MDIVCLICLLKIILKVEKFEIMKPSLHDIFIEKVGEE